MPKARADKPRARECKLIGLRVPEAIYNRIANSAAGKGFKGKNGKPKPGAFVESLIMPMFERAGDGKGVTG